MIKDLIEVKQLPIIEQHLKNVSLQIDEEMKNIENLICTEETVKTIKELRAKYNKQFKEYETQRKEIEEQVLRPWNDFKNIYKECIADKFRNTDLILKGKIELTENELKAKKEQEVKEYFEEYKTVNNIDFIEYVQARINVTLSASMKSLKEQAKVFIDKVVDDLNLIETQEHKAEILVEYRQTLNVSNAITTVSNRFKAIEEEKKRQEEQKIVHIEMNENHEITKQCHEELEKAFNREMKETQINQKTYTITFKVTETAPRLKQLKDYLIREGYQYE